MKKITQYSIKAMLLCLLASIGTTQLNAQWHTTGAAAFSAGTAFYTTLVTNSGTPYVAYSDGANGLKATVKKLDANNNWINVGAAVSAGQADYTVLAFNGNVPYVAYSDATTGTRTTVMAFTNGSWVLVGAAGFSTGGGAVSLAFSGSGTPYLAYADGMTGKTTVMSFTSGSWGFVGAASFSDGAIAFPSLAFNGNTPYVAYLDGGNSSRATVKMFDGSTWQQVGAAGFSTGQAYYNSLVFNGSTPYLAYQDYQNGDKAVVKKFDGNNWITVGTNPVSDGGADYTSLAFKGSTPYVAYRDYANNYKATVKKLDGNSWTTVGNVGFSGGSFGYGVAYTSLAFNGGKPYVAYQDAFNSSKATVMQYEEPTICTGGISVPAIGNAAPICVGSTNQLTNSLPGGVWTSNNGYASVNAAGVVTGLSAGTASIQYKVTSGACVGITTINFAINSNLATIGINYVWATVQGNNYPQRGPGSTYCPNHTFTVVGTPSGGTWSSTGGMTVGATSGIINIGGIAGPIGVTYTTTINGCTKSKTINGVVATFCNPPRGVNGIATDLINNEFTMYPNPARSSFNLDIKSLIGAGSIVVTDLFGKQVKTQILSMGGNNVDVSSLSKGFYLVSIITSEGKTTKKLVVE